MNSGSKILLFFVFVLILDLILTIIAMVVVPTWNVLIVFGICFVVSFIAVGYIYSEYFD